MTGLTPPIQLNQAAAPFVAQKSQDNDAQVTIANNGFFPDLELFDFQTKYRVDASHHEERQAQALQEAMITVNKELSRKESTEECKISWVEQQKQQGFSHLHDVPAEAYGDQTAKDIQYLNAVYSRAKYLLVERYPELFFGKHDRSEKQDPDQNNADQYLQESRQQIRELMDKPRCTIDLI